MSEKTSKIDVVSCLPPIAKEELRRISQDHFYDTDYETAVVLLNSFLFAHHRKFVAIDSTSFGASGLYSLSPKLGQSPSPEAVIQMMDCVMESDVPSTIGLAARYVSSHYAKHLEQGDFDS